MNHENQKPNGVGRARIPVIAGMIAFLAIGIGCSSQPITTGAAAYWEVAHSEEVEARTELQEEAAEAFYPSADAFKPNWDLVHDTRKAAAHGDEEAGHGPGAGNVRSPAIPDSAEAQNSSNEKH